MYMYEYVCHELESASEKISFCGVENRKNRVSQFVLLTECVSNSSESLICNYSSMDVPASLFVVCEPKLF